MKYGIQNFLRIAKSYVEADTTTLDGIERKLIAWYCFTFSTTPNDPKLLDMTLEELLVLFQMHRLRNSPQEVEDETNPDAYEEWLKKEMGETYLDETSMIKGMEEEEKSFQKRVREKFPDKVSTDFSQFKE